MCEYELFCINFINEEKSGEYSRSDWVPERPPTQNLRVAALVELFLQARYPSATQPTRMH